MSFTFYNQYVSVPYSKSFLSYTFYAQSLENNFSIETEQNDENDAEYEKYLSQSYDSVSGLLDSFSKQQNIVTEDNVNQAICSFGML